MRTPINRMLDGVLAPVRGLHSLRPTQLDAVQATLASSLLKCTVDGHDDYDGNMMIMVTPSAAAGHTDTYILLASRSGFELAVAGEDSFESMACFQTLVEAVGHLIQLITLVSQQNRVQAA